MYEKKQDTAAPGRSRETGRQVLALLKDTGVTRIVVEHKDRLTRFGANYLETQGRTIEVVNVAENEREDLIADPVAIVDSFTIQAVSKKGLKRGLIQPSMLGIEVSTKQTKIVQVRIIPHKGFYAIEVVYERKEVQAAVDPVLMASVDIGVNNLVALTSNKQGFVPLLVNGRPLKSLNQCYNKQREHRQKKLKKQQFTSAHLERLTIHRTRRIDHYLHTASKRLIEVLIAEGIGTLIIGKNPLWKQEPAMWKKDKQHFVQLSHARFIDMLCYKAKLVGIQVILQEESYTSKASFLDRDPIPTYSKIKSEPVFSGKRVKRGLYRAENGKKVNADVNGSYNILRKASPKAFGNGVEGAAVHPRRLVV